MYLTKILSVTLFAVLATAAPAPAGVSVDAGQIAQLAQSFDSFSQSTASGIADLSAQLRDVSVGFSGQDAESLRQVLDVFLTAGKQIQNAASSVSQSLKEAGTSYEQTESQGADVFFV
ncbi:hypothetical protein BJX76DRAFT_320022 [Aspergillus varians]